MVDAVNNTSDGTIKPEQDKVAGTTNAGAPPENEEKKAAEKRAKKLREEAEAAPQSNSAQDIIDGAKKRLKQPAAQDEGLKAEEPQKAAPAKSLTDLQSEDKKGQEQSRFVQINPQHQQTLFKHPKWGDAMIDDNLAETIDKGSVKKTMTGGINFVLNNGHTVMWRPEYGARPANEDEPATKGIEFIGVQTGSFMKKFEESDAKAVIAVSKMRGWTGINVHGKPHEKEMMWLEAQRQGLIVKNFVPSAEVAEKWKIEQKQREADKHLTGVNNAADGIPVPTEEDKKEGPEAKKQAKNVKEPEKAAAKKKPISNIQANSGKRKRTAKPGPKTVGPIAGETTDQYFSRKIHNARTDEEKEGFRALAAALQNGDLNIEDVQMTKLLRDELSGTTIAQELNVAKKVLGGLSPAVNDSIIKRDITTTSEKAVAKAAGNEVKAETAKPKAKAAAAAAP